MWGNCLATMLPGRCCGATLVLLLLSSPLAAADMWCEAESTEELELSLSRAEEPERQPVPWITVAELHQWLETDVNRPLLADMRLPASFQLAHIPGALPLRASELAGLVSVSTVVLIGTGYDGQHLEQLAQRFLSRGADIRILQGGIAAWAVNEEYPLNGIRDLRQLLAVPAESALLLISGGEWRILEFDTQSDIGVAHRMLLIGSEQHTVESVAIRGSLRTGIPIFFADGDMQTLRVAERMREERLARVRTRPVSRCGL